MTKKVKGNLLLQTVKAGVGGRKRKNRRVGSFILGSNYMYEKNYICETIKSVLFYINNLNKNNM